MEKENIANQIFYSKGRGSYVEQKISFDNSIITLFEKCLKQK